MESREKSLCAPAVDSTHSLIIRSKILLQVPRAKTETRWQKFARENGIQKKKRSRSVFEESTGEYLPRWGRGSIKKSAEDAQWVIEEKQRPVGAFPQGEDQFEDPFQQARAEKKKSKDEQLRRERRNVAARSKAESRDAFAATSLSASTAGARLSAGMSQARLSRAVKLVQKATRSMGDFDQHRPDEPEMRKKRTAKRASSLDEKSTSLKVLDKIVRADKETGTVTGAVNRLLDEQRKSAKRRKTTEAQ